ncbi:MAG: mechanosensitive ion channel family protein [Alphaproteobacteria bacterium]
MSSVEDFWKLIVDVWVNGFMGVDIGSILLGLLVFIVALMVRRLFTVFVVDRIKQLTQHTETEIDDHVIEALYGPIRFVPVIIGVFAAGRIMPLDGLMLEIHGKLIQALVIYNIFWAFHVLVEPVFTHVGKIDALLTSSMKTLLVKTLRVLFILLGGAIILESFGVEVAPLLAGLGIFGVAVAFGAQDLFKNLIAGALVVVEKRFKIGDWIRIEGIVEGIVEDIGFRSTVVRQFDKVRVMVPNADFSEKAVLNFSEMTHRRIYWKIGVTYDTNVDQLANIRKRILDYVTETDDFAPAWEVSTFCRIDSFGPSSIDIALYCFTTTTNWLEWLEIKEKLAFEIKHIVADEGSSFAFPSQSIYVEQLPSAAEFAELSKPERFDPAPQPLAEAGRGNEALDGGDGDG